MQNINIFLNQIERHYIQTYFRRFFDKNSPELNDANMQAIENMILANSEWIKKIPNESRIQTLCQHYIRFDTESGEFMSSGWIVKNDGVEKPFLFISGKGGDKAIERAQGISLNRLGYTLKNLLSQKFSLCADWVNFWENPKTYP